MAEKPRWSRRRKILYGFGFLSVAVIVLVGSQLAYWYTRGGPIGPTGLKVILYPLQDEFRLGEPMRFRVVVQAMGWKSVTRDFQRYQFCHNVYEIRGPDGEELPDAGPVGQSLGGPIQLKIFQRLLAREGDILLKYSIVEEGEYIIQVKRLAEDLPESNVVTFRVEGGTVPEVEGVVAALRTVAPKHWSVGRASYKFESYTDESGHEVKGIWIDVARGLGQNRVTLLFTKTETEYRLESKRVRWEHFGRNEHGHFYGIAVPKTDESWPTYHKDIRRALELKKSGAYSDLHSRLPEGFDKDFILPDADEDQHGNPVVIRNNSRNDPETGFPYEIWLKKPRMEFVFIPAGEFLMGSPHSEEGRESDEGPVHRVQITKPFYIAKYEVTQEQWSTVMGGNPSFCKKAGNDAPVEKVLWTECMAFCRKTGVSLPTEAQWEYACRAGTQTPFHLGSDITIHQVNFDGRALDVSEEDLFRDTTVKVGTFEPNAWGMYNMHGNVMEWCGDIYDASFYSKPEATAPDPMCESGDIDHVLRGGTWIFNAKSCRSAARFTELGQTVRAMFTGFRTSRQLR